MLLKHGESYTVPESDYGKAEIYRINNVFILFSIPLYGGEPVYENVFGTHRVEDLIERVNSWS